MSVRLLISLPVHECRRVIEDQLRNLAFFLNDPVVVLHLSQSYRDDVDFSAFPNVVVNPQRFPTRWGNISYLHCANVRHALDAGLEFDFVVHAASNELYLRHGLENYLESASAAFDDRGRPGPDGEFPLHNAFFMKVGLNSIRKSVLPALCESRGERVCHAPIEGSSYRRDAIRRMYDLLDAEIGLEGLLDGRGGTEETVFPSLFMAVASAEEKARVRRHTCFMDWRYELGVGYWKKIIRHLAGVAPDSSVAAYLRDVDAPPEVFSVKRIPRTYFDPLRCLVRDELMGGFSLPDDRAAEYRRQDDLYLRAERRAAWRGKKLRQNLFFGVCGVTSRLLGRRWSYLRFDVLEAWRRRRRQSRRNVSSAEPL